MDKKIDIIKETDGNNIVVIDNLHFMGRLSVHWNIVEDRNIDNQTIADFCDLS